MRTPDTLENSIPSASNPHSAGKIGSNRCPSDFISEIMDPSLPDFGAARTCCKNKIVGTIRSHGCPYLKSVFCLTKLPDVTGSDQGNSASFHFRGQRIRNGRSLSGVWVYISVLFFWPDADLPENARVSSTVNCFKISCTSPRSP